MAAARNKDAAIAALVEAGAHFQHFDFADTKSVEVALRDSPVVFLLRPPQLADTKKYFDPFVSAAVKHRIPHIVFLSVQGAEKNPFIPHHKIEKLIKESGLPFTLLRPAYFMQNFDTTMHEDVAVRHQLFMPAGNAAFVMVDVRDIGAVAAKVLTEPTQYVNTAYEITGAERLTFQEMARQLTAQLPFNVTYTSPNLFRYALTRRREGMPWSFVFVTMLLHALPRLQPAPPITDCVASILNRAPLTFQQYVTDYKEKLQRR